MSTNKVTAKDRLDFIHLMSSANKSNDQQKRVDTCLEKLDISEVRPMSKTEKGSQKNSYENYRKKHRPDITANLLSLMSAPNGLKFLTHDFDPNSDMTMSIVIDKANEIIHSDEYRFKIPGSLYLLFNGFINGDKWTDYKRALHSFYLKSDRLTNWFLQSPNLHPIASDELGDEINSFRNTIRVSKPNLDSIFRLLLSNNTKFSNFKVKTDKLDKADFYTNVFWMTFMIFKKILFDISQRNTNAEISIKYERSTWQEYRLCSVRITHLGSEANPFDETKMKLLDSGGALFNIMSSCVGYCDWTVEANFEGEFKRWRILNFRNLPEEENLDETEVEGFSHIFTFYKK